jgi:hypothetical protein
MKTQHRIHTALAAALLALLAVGNVRADHGNNNNNDNNQNMRMRANLTGPAIQGTRPEGNADFRADNGRTRLQVEVERVNLPAGTVLAVFLQSGTAAPVKIGTITISATGFGELELESDHGAMVPAVQSGDTIMVSNAGVSILAGVFGPA